MPVSRKLEAATTPPVINFSITVPVTIEELTYVLFGCVDSHNNMIGGIYDVDATWLKLFPQSLQRKIDTEVRKHVNVRAINKEVRDEHIDKDAEDSIKKEFGYTPSLFDKVLLLASLYKVSVSIADNIPSMTITFE